MDETAGGKLTDGRNGDTVRGPFVDCARGIDMQELDSVGEQLGVEGQYSEVGHAYAGSAV